MQTLKHCKFKTSNSEETDILFQKLFRVGIGLRYLINYKQSGYSNSRLFKYDEDGLSRIYEHEYDNCKLQELSLETVSGRLDNMVKWKEIIGLNFKIILNNETESNEFVRLINNLNLMDELENGNHRYVLVFVENHKLNIRYYNNIYNWYCCGLPEININNLNWLLDQNWRLK